MYDSRFGKRLCEVFLLFLFFFEKILCILVCSVCCATYVFRMPLRKWELSFGWFKSNATQITTKRISMNNSFSIDKQKKKNSKSEIVDAVFVYYFKKHSCNFPVLILALFFVCICVDVVHKLETFLDSS